MGVIHVTKTKRLDVPVNLSREYPIHELRLNYVIGAYKCIHRVIRMCQCLFEGAHISLVSARQCPKPEADMLRVKDEFFAGFTDSYVVRKCLKVCG